MDLYSVRVLALDAVECRVRLRVFLVHYDRLWGHEGLLPDDSSFFFRVLWQAADGVAKRRRGPLNDLVSIEEWVDPEWGAANAGRFVQRVERVATRNYPAGDEELDALANFHVDHFDSLAAFYHEWDRRWQHEDRLVQADYDVTVTDPRWLAPLQRRQGWCTDAFPSGAAGRLPVVAAGSAWARLGWFRADRGDLAGAAAAYRRATELGDAHTIVAALLALDGLGVAGARTGPADELEREARAALELCVRLRAAGQQDEARAAYLLAHQSGNPALLAEARARAGMETPAEHGYRLARDGRRAAAAAELRRAYEPSSLVVELGLALYARDVDSARRLLDRVGGDSEASWAGRLAIDLAFLHARAGDDDMVDDLVELVGMTHTAAAAWSYALGNGGAYPVEALVGIGEKLVEWMEPHDYDVAGSDALDWCREAFWASVVELGGIEQAGLATLELARLLVEIGDIEAARAACVCVTQLGDDQASDRAWLALAQLYARTGDIEAAHEVYEMVVGTGAPGPAALAREALDTVADESPGVREASVVDEHGSGPVGHSYAAFCYARQLHEQGRDHQARELLVKIVAQQGEGVARAVVELGTLALRARDEAAARAWWLRAVETGDRASAHAAAMELGWLAKDSRDLPEALRWYGPIAESAHQEAPLAAAHVGELYYWLGERDEAVRWYQRALAGTDEPELVGEAAFRCGEILSGRGEVRSARALLRQAVESGDPTFAPQATDLLATLGQE